MHLVLPEAYEIPDFASENEEREWLATHDTSKLAGKDVVLRPARPKEQIARVVAVPTDQETIDRLRQLAAERGLDYHELVRA